MKKVFSKELWKKFLAVLIIIVSCMVVRPVQVEAVDVAGSLAEPIADLLLGIGDSIVDVVTKFIIYGKKDYCPNCPNPSGNGKGKFWTDWLYAEDSNNGSDYDEKVKSGICPYCRWRIRKV